MIIGSVSRYVADHGAGPVVVVRQQSMTMHRKVVVGLRDADQAAVLAFAFQEAALRQAGVLVLNAWHWFLPAALLPAALRPGPNAERISADSGNWLTEVLAGWRDKYPQVDVSQEVAHASPGQALLDASAGADLVVLGRAGSKPGELGGGAVRHAILHHGECPVAVIPG